MYRLGISRPLDSWYRTHYCMTEGTLEPMVIRVLAECGGALVKRRGTVVSVRYLFEFKRKRDRVKFEKWCLARQMRSLAIRTTV